MVPYAVVRQSEPAAQGKYMASPKYYPQVDALRAFAMTGVVFVHTLHDDPRTSVIRITLFVVVSAYLMTNLLLKGRGENVLITVRNFYIRRELRLLPALFALLAVAWLSNMPSVRSSIGWHILQLTNVYYFLYDTWEPWVLDHLWSLSMLEQFCLVWAPLVLLLKRRWLVTVLWLMFPLAVISRFVSSEFWPGSESTILPPAWADAVAAGALVAVYSENISRARWLTSPWVLIISLVLVLSPLALPQYDAEVYHIQVRLACTLTLMGALGGYRGWLGAVLSNPVLGYLGKISYGVFMYHLFVWAVLTHFGMPFERGPLTFLIVFGATLPIAALSYHLYERPIANLKRLVPVARQAQ